MEEILPRLRSVLSASGVDICEPFRVRSDQFPCLLSFPPTDSPLLRSWNEEKCFQRGTTLADTFFVPTQVSEYNALVKRFPLNTYNRSDAMAVVVGSTKVFWPHFEAFIQSFQDDEEIPKDPMDTFYQTTISRALSQDAQLSQVAHEVRYDWNAPRSGRFVHVQTAGHLAGFAFYDQDVFWSCHPMFGLWFVYRAVIIFDIDWQGPSPPPAKPVLDDVAKAEMRKWTEVANSEQWQVRATRLKLRDSCPIGKDLYRYYGDCLSFFFPIAETPADVIARIRAKPNLTLSTHDCGTRDANSPATGDNGARTAAVSDQQAGSHCCANTAT